MNEFLQVMGLPILACFLFAGIHAYLGFHVIERQVIFVDLALAQIAVLGTGVSFLFGHALDSGFAYALSLFFTVVGAGIFSFTRFKNERVSQEAIIGIVYAVSAALLVLILGQTGEGDEHIRQMLIGNILLVTLPEIITIALIYTAIGIFHFTFRRVFFDISTGRYKRCQDKSDASVLKYQDPAEGNSVALSANQMRWWDFLFYVSFGCVVTSSVKIAGVLLVFAFLIIPPVCAVLFCDQLKSRLIFGWVVGLGASVVGMGGAYIWDLPVGASVVCAFGGLLVILALIKAVFFRRWA